ncbi:MAG: RCC1 domain-containing protein [Candidatus Izemoplasmataceae bacterium]
MKRLSLLLSVLLLFGLAACSESSPEDESVLNYKQVQTGLNHTVLLTENGEVYTWGASLYGVLGNGVSSIDLNYNEPINITEKFNLNENEFITRIYAGIDFNFALTSEHRVFAWGNNQFNSLGINPKGIITIPRDITNLIGLREGETIEHISINWHSFILTSDHRVIAFGSNLYGQIGNMKKSSLETTGELFTDITDNFFLNDEEKILFVHADNRHSWAITSEFRVFIWGTISTTLIATFPIDKPVTIALNDKEEIIDVASPNIPGFKTNEGTLFVIGTRLTLPENTLELVAYPINENLNLDEDDQIKDIYQNQGIQRLNGIVVTEKGLIIPWGSNPYGELGYDPGRNVTINPPYLDEDETYTSIHDNFSLEDEETIVQISIGRNHVILVTSLNRVFTWGRNTYGTLGDGTFEDRMTPFLVSINPNQS